MVVKSKRFENVCLNLNRSAVHVTITITVKNENQNWFWFESDSYVNESPLLHLTESLFRRCFIFDS
jgi:hypothetical protein